MTRWLLGAALALAAAADRTPQSVVDELLAADRAFAAASASTDLVSGLTAMFAEDVVIPMPPGQFVDGKASVVAALRTNVDNLTAGRSGRRSAAACRPTRGTASRLAT